MIALLLAAICVFIVWFLSISLYLRQATFYSIAITRRDTTLVEQPMVEHHYCTSQAFFKEWRNYYEDLVNRGFTTNDYHFLKTDDVKYTQILKRIEFLHEDTDTVVTMEAKQIKGFREFSDHTLRRIKPSMKLTPAQANLLRKEHLRLKYPVLDKRYYVYIVTRLWINNYGHSFDDPEVKVFRHLEGEGGALTSIYSQHQDAEIMANTSEYPMVIEVDGDQGRVRYKIDRQLF